MRLTNIMHLCSDGEFDKIQIKVRLSESADTVALLKIPELSVEIKLPISGGFGETVINKVPQLWSPDDPKLYDVSLECGDDTVRDRVGFRQISTEGTDILLNGKPIFLRGVSCHEESVKNGRSLTEDEIIENLCLVKELGCNFMRAAHYPHSERLAQLADECGILLWEEIPVYWAVRFGSRKRMKMPKIS